MVLQCLDNEAIWIWMEEAVDNGLNFEFEVNSTARDDFCRACNEACALHFKLYRKLDISSPL